MTEISLLQLELLFALIWLACRIVVWIRKRRIDWKREAVLLLMFVNLAVIIRFVFFPMSRVNGKVQSLRFDPAAVFPFKLNLLPFVHLLEYDSKKEMLLNVIGNTAMFIPTGVILPIISKKLKTFWRVIGVGALISLCIEIIQLPFFERTSDIDDLLLNTLGVAIGYLIYKLVLKLIKRRR
ncbi:MAG: VanZ family protein [Oscillospiraceae bacterium]|nr:VanZ family protein [Oscillospiraceae bacterium]